MQDNYNFNLTSRFRGYISSLDSTITPFNTLIKGSINVYKKISGTIANRFGLKRRGTADATAAGVTASFEWITSFGKTYPIRVLSNGFLQAEILISGVYTWTTLLSGFALTRWVFDTWWSSAEFKDRLLAVRGDSNIFSWSGGVANVAYAGNSSPDLTSVAVFGNSSSLKSFSLAMSTVASFPQATTVAYNGASGTLAAAIIKIAANNPFESGDTVTFIINGTSVVITFVGPIGSTPGNVLIGATAAITASNLMGIITNPGTTNSTQIALSSANQALMALLSTNYGGTLTLQYAGGNVITLASQGSASFSSLALATTSAHVTVSVANNIGTVTFDPANQISPGDTITATINGTAITLTGVSTIGSTPGNFLIGSTVEATITNFLNLVAYPATTNATQVALSSPNQALMGLIQSAPGVNSWSQNGFASITPSEKLVTIGGQTYLYSGGEDSGVLTGVTPNPGSIVAGALAVQNVIVNADLPSINTVNDFLKVVNNQVYIGSYTSRQIYISSEDDYTNYTVPTPRAPGDPELVILDELANGIASRLGNAYVSAGLSDWFIISFSDITVNTTLTQITNVSKNTIGGLCTALAHEFIDTIGNDIVFLAKDQQVRVYSTVRNVVDPQFPSLSQDVKTEFSEENFVGGALRAIGDFIYITAPANGRDWMYQARQSVNELGNVETERLWHPPQIRSISRFAVISGVTYGHSCVNPQIYQVWDTAQWHDDSPTNDPIPYNCIMMFAYQQLEMKGGVRRQGLMRFDKVYVEGYIAPGSLVNGNVYFDYQGATGVQGITLNSIKKPVKTFIGGNLPSLGTYEIGQSPLGTGVIADSNDQDLLPKFRAIRKVNPQDAFEVSLQLYSTDPDCRWEVLSLGFNGELAAAQAVFI